MNESNLAYFRKSMREPAMLPPRVILPTNGVVYYSQDVSLPVPKEEVTIKNTLNTPTQVLSVEKEKVVQDTKKVPGVLYAAIAIAAGLFFINRGN